MARVPTYEAQQGIDVNSAPSVVLDDGAARAYGQMGQAIGQAGSSVEQGISVVADFQVKREVEKIDFNAKIGMQKLLQDQQAEDADEIENLTGDASGFTERRRQAYDARTEAFLQTIPEGLRPQYQAQLEAQKTSYLATTSAVEREQRYAYAGEQIGIRQNEMMHLAAGDPSQVEFAIQSNNDWIDSAPIPEGKKDELRRAGADAIRTAATNGMIQAGQFQAAHVYGRVNSNTADAVFGSMLEQETGGIADPSSAVSAAGALGTSQLMPGTAREQAAVMGYTTISNMTDSQLKAYFATPEGNAANLDIGRAYFNRQLEAFGGDFYAAAIAYNGGPLRAQQWLAAGRDDSVLPKETANYVREVMGRVQIGMPPAGQAMRLPAPTNGEMMNAATFQSNHYTWADFRNDRWDNSKLDPRVPMILDNMTDQLGMGKLTLTSGYRSPTHPVEAKKANGGGQHTHGNAVDISYVGMSEVEKTNLVAAAVANGANAIGMYPPGSSAYGTIHMDVREGRGKGPGGLFSWMGSAGYEAAEPWFKAGVEKGLQMRGQQITGNATTLIASSSTQMGAASQMPAPEVAPDAARAPVPGAAVTTEQGLSYGADGALLGYDENGFPIQGSPFSQQSSGNRAPAPSAPMPVDDNGKPLRGQALANAVGGDSTNGAQPLAPPQITPAVPSDAQITANGLAPQVQPDLLPMPQAGAGESYNNYQQRVSMTIAENSRRTTAANAANTAAETAMKEQAAAMREDRKSEISEFERQIFFGQASTEEILQFAEANGLSWDEQEPLFAEMRAREERIRAEQTRRETADNKAAAAAEQERQARVSQLGIGLQDGTATWQDVLDLRAEDPTILSASEYSTLRGYYEGYIKREKGATDAIADVNSGRAFNPFVEADRKTADTAVQALIKQANGRPHQPGRDADPGLIPNQIQQVIRKTGIVPQSIIDLSRASVVGGDASKAEPWLQMLGNVVKENPSALAAGDGSKDVRDMGVAFNYWVEKMGLSAAEATKMIMRQQEPAYKDAALKLVERGAINKERNQIMENGLSEITRAFDRDTGPFWFLPGEPAAGATSGAVPEFNGQLMPNQQQAMMSEYITWFEDSFVNNGGNAQLAREQAIEGMRRTWGVTQVYGGAAGTIVKYPVEAAYPKMTDTETGEESHAWIARQAAEDVKAATGVTVKPQDIILMPLPSGETHRDFMSQSRPPRYALYYWANDEQGQRVLFSTNQAFQGDTDAELDRISQIAEQRRLNPPSFGQQVAGRMREALKRDPSVRAGIDMGWLPQ